MVSTGPVQAAVLLLCLAAVPALVPAQERSGEDSTGISYRLLSEEIRGAEQDLAVKLLGTGGALGASDVERLEDLAQKAHLSLFGDLIDRSALLAVLAREQLADQALSQERTARAAAIMASRQLDQQAAAADKRRSIALLSSLGAGAASFAAAFGFWYLSEWHDRQYFLATTIDDAVEHRNYFKLFAWASYLSAGVGVVSAGVTIPILAGARR